METTHEFVKIETSDLLTLLQDAVKKVQGFALKKSVKIHLEIVESISISADKEKLIQAFINILSNCIRHAKANVNISVTREQRVCHIIICDDGNGFDKEDLEHLFERFYKGKNGSTVLGMNITKSIINKLGGQIKVFNGSNGGARFIVTLAVV